MIKYLLPYVLVEILSYENFKKIFKKLLPYGFVLFYQKRQKNYSVEFIKTNYLTDLTEAEKWTLLSFIKSLEFSKENVSYLEVGIYAGATIKFLKEKTLKVTFSGIDLFDDFEPTVNNTHVWKNFRMQDVYTAIGNDRVTLYKGDSKCVLPTIQEKFDFIFIDGNHTYEATYADFLLCKKKLKRNGFIAFHNASPGLFEEDKKYIMNDGGPWRVTMELDLDKELTYIVNIDRIKIYQIHL